MEIVFAFFIFIIACFNNIFCRRFLLIVYSNTNTNYKLFVDVLRNIFIRIVGILHIITLFVCAFQLKSYYNDIFSLWQHSFQLINELQYYFHKQFCGSRPYTLGGIANLDIMMWRFFYFVWCCVTEYLIKRRSSPRLK